jgi:hypothetical protein
LPEDTYYFAGHQGQLVVIIPSENLVVLRTGVTENSGVAQTEDRLKIGETISALLQVIDNAH